MYKHKKTISRLLESCSQKKNPLGMEIKHAKQEMELARHHYDQAQGAWIDVCAHALRAAELKYAQLIRLAKSEESVHSS